MVTVDNGSEAIWKWSKTAFDPVQKRILVKGEPGYDALEAQLPIAGVAGTHTTHDFSAVFGERAGKLSAMSLAFPALPDLLSDTPPSPDKAARAYDDAYRVENPAKVIIPTTDCASCHVATSYRLAAESQHAKAASRDEYAAPAGITAQMEADIRKFMATGMNVVLNFGYLDANPSISQRTVNESAEAARFLRANF